MFLSIWIMEPFLPMTLGTFVGEISRTMPPVSFRSPWSFIETVIRMYSSNPSTLSSSTSPVVMNFLVSPNSTLQGTSFTCSGDGHGAFMSTSQLDALMSTIFPMTRSPLAGMYCPASGTTPTMSDRTVLIPSCAAKTFLPSAYAPGPGSLPVSSRRSPGTTISLAVSLESPLCILLSLHRVDGDKHSARQLRPDLVVR